MARRDEDDARTLGRNARVVHRGRPAPDPVPKPVMPPAQHTIVPPGGQAEGSAGGRMAERASRAEGEDQGGGKPDQAEGTNDNVQ